MSAAGEFDDVPPGDRDAALAGEYALRLLDPAEERAAAAREATDPAFAAEVARWRVDLAALDADFAPAAPPADGFARIEARLFPEAARPSALARLWGSAALWRGLTAAAAAVAVWFAVVPRDPGPERLAELIAAMAPREGGGEFVAAFDPETGTISVTRLLGAADQGRVFELWALVDQAPVSLGLLPDAPQAEIVLPPELAARIGAGTLVEVSEEPAGGSPVGRPTGAVMAAGFLRDV
jgi:anti-sigma-K factor RskA